MSFSTWIAASFSRWVVRTRPNVPAKSTSQSRGVVVRRASSTSSRRNGREPSTRNAMYRYRGRRVLTLGDGGEMEKGSGKKRRRSAYFVHFGGRLHRTGVHLFAEEGLRLDARDHEEDPHRVLQVVLDGTTPDDPRLRVDLLAHDLRGLLRLGHRQVRPADDAHERPARMGQVDLAEQRGLEGLVDRVVDPVPLFLALADSDHRDAAAFHDRHEVRVVEVDEAGLRDDLRHAFDRLHEDLIGHLERRVDRQAGHELEELVVVDHDRRVAGLAELVESSLRVLHPDAAFGFERHRDDAHREGAFLLRDASDVLRGARPGPATHPRGDEHDVSAPEEVPDLLFVLVGGLFADLRERTGPEAFREPLPDEDLLRRMDGQQVFRVGVHGGQLGARDAGLAAPVDRVRPAATAADDLDRDVDRLNDLLDLLVVAVLLLFDDLGLLGLPFFLRLGFLVSSQGFVEK